MMHDDSFAILDVGCCTMRCRMVFRAFLTVDNSRTYSTLVATTARQLQLRDSRLYIGGVPSVVDLDRTVMPVRQSLIGGFTTIAVNGRCVAHRLIIRLLCLAVTQICNWI